MIDEIREAILNLKDGEIPDGVVTHPVSPEQIERMKELFGENLIVCSPEQVKILRNNFEVLTSEDGKIEYVPIIKV